MHTNTLNHAAASWEVQRVAIEVIEGPDQGAAVHGESGEPVSLGTAPDNTLVLKDATVSRYHVEFAPSALGISIRDLDSSNGTWLSEARITAAELTSGTQVRIGKNTLRVASADAPTSEVSDFSFEGVIASGARMRKELSKVEKLAQSNVSVLIHGETGTGKERIAELLHELGPRRDKPLEVVDCGSMPTALIASELFGHERGAFTGAVQKRIGAFERADGGTVFLDEIGELPGQVQAVLLGALERRSFVRLGGSERIKVDVRLVAATHRELRKSVNQDEFRPDLYYRIAAARVRLPPLRERPEDIEHLVRHFVTLVQGSPEPFPFNPQVLDELRRQHWAGNIRELRNVVEAALAMGEVEFDHTNEHRVAEAEPSSSSATPRRPTLAELDTYKNARAVALAEFEKVYLAGLIEACEGNATKAARHADMDRGYLGRLLSKHGLK